MSYIEIQRSHKLGIESAKALAEDLAQDLAKEFSIDHYWEDGVLFFQRTGVEGVIQVGEEEILVEAKLGFLLLAFKNRIEQEIEGYLDHHFLG